MSAHPDDPLAPRPTDDDGGAAVERADSRRVGATTTGNGADTEPWSAASRSTPPLSADAADRLAARIRPSWEPPRPAGVELGSAPEPPDGDDSWAPAITEPLVAHLGTAEKATPAGQRALRAAAAAEETVKISASMVVARRPIWPWATAAIAAIILLGVVVAVSSSDEDELAGVASDGAAAVPPESARANAEPAPPPAAAVMGTSADAPRADAPELLIDAPEALIDEPDDSDVPPPRTVAVQAATIPSNATLTLDGEVVPNPFRREVEDDGQVHRFEASARGYRTESTSVRFDRDRAISIRLPLDGASRSPTAMRRTATTMRRQTQMDRAGGFVTSNPY